MRKKISVGILVLIFFSIVNIFIIRGTCRETLMFKLSEENPITMSRDDILKLDFISYDEKDDITNVRFIALKPGNVTVTYHRENVDEKGIISDYSKIDYTVYKIYNSFLSGMHDDRNLHLLSKSTAICASFRQRLHHRPGMLNKKGRHSHPTTQGTYRQSHLVCKEANGKDQKRHQVRC